ncbi:hypothetical protein FGM00_13545 [Aggregatimonas sangjinii]|uniref:Uncharacterized protein n=1 Tax=Aggregatimonas sangjinii TaxID=2583587 RepID=A0A5B7SUX3_9FLAO|nr:hypothetical protein [Aggregatimonas sangjinii]QCX01089.1 hypothetical protein FGM00_13545 [Aggregatimonas sangjinii]
MRIFLSFILTAFFALNAQGQLNDYKYIVVPKRFDGFKKENQYQTSTLVKHLFANNGFNTVYEDALPNDLNANRCLGLRVRLDEKSSMFTTKTKLVLEDCNNQDIFISQEGRSREKDFKLSYNEAITEAFNSIAALDYVYVEKSNDDTVTLGFKNDVKNLKGEPGPEKSDNQADRSQSVQQVATEDEQSFKSMEPVASNYEKGARQNPEKGQQIATPEVQSYEDNTPVVSQMQKAPNTTGVADEMSLSSALYAQELENGYQLVDSTPKIVMTLTKTSLSDIYAAKSNTQSGIVFRRDGKWLFEYVAGGETVQKELNIKF